MQKVIFLDRDGVINKSKIINGKPYAPLFINELEILEGVSEAINIFKKKKYKCIVVTNQPDVSKKKTSKKNVIEINNYLKLELCIDDFFVCYHDDYHACECRKPKIGLFLMADKKWNIDFNKSIMIGDRWKDIKPAKKLGCKTFFIDYKYNENYNIVYDHKVLNLLEAAYYINKYY